METQDLDETVEMFQQGMELGKVWAKKASDGLTVWAEKNPEQVVLAGLAVGFVLGKLLFGGKRREA
ncbi:MAG TPA: hypothetical protein VH083_05215 [Myxococcales bacterium]|jgi:hypothetical protein|nr:hypothetical protein [Myxococcales bacterium]